MRALRRAVKMTNKKKQVHQQACKMHTHHTALGNAAARNSNCPCHGGQFGILVAHPHGRSCAGDSHPGTHAAAPVTPREPIFTKGEKTCPDSRPTRMQNFTPLAFSVAEKSVPVTVQKKTKTHRMMG